VNWVPPNKAKESAKETLFEVAQESKRMTDTNAGSEKVEQILLIGLTRKDLDCLNLVASYYPKIKNYGVLVRRVLKDRAKTLPQEAQGSLF
jgi:hypothetical protein